MLRRREDGLVEEFFGPDPRDQSQEIARHLADQGLQISRRPEADEFGHSLQLADEAGRRDRNFRTEVTVTTGETPIPEWAQRPALLMTSEGSDRSLRIAAWPERETDEPAVVIWFDEGEEGRAARWEVATALASRGEAKLPKGATARLSHLPEAMRAIAGTDSRTLSGSTITASQSHRVTLIGEDDGGPIERTMELVAVPPLEPTPEGEQAAAFGCLDDTLSLFLGFRLSPGKVAISAWASLNLLDPTNLEGVVEALRLLVAFDRGCGRVAAPSLFPEPISFGSAEEENARVNRGALRFFEDLILLPDALGVERFALGPVVSKEENLEVATAARLIESREGRYEFLDLAAEVPADMVAELERQGFRRIVARFPVIVDLLGEERFLGIGEGELPDPSEAQVHDARDPAKRMVKLGWSEVSSFPIKLVSDPGGEPAETGLWPAGRAPSPSARTDSSS